ncbi:MAG: hypothetical protein ACSHX6_06275 [Akkermansiaceae bacterium]
MTKQQQDNDTLEPPPNYPLDTILFITKTLLITAATFALAWLLVNIKFS